MSARAVVASVRVVRVAASAEDSEAVSVVAMAEAVSVAEVLRRDGEVDLQFDNLQSTI